MIIVYIRIIMDTVVHIFGRYIQVRVSFGLHRIALVSPLRRLPLASLVTPGRVAI
jgi:hypothetical protein